MASSLGRGGLPPYSPVSSTASVANGARVVTFTGTALQATNPSTNAIEYAAGLGDDFAVDGISVRRIASVDSPTQVTLLDPWTAATQTNVAASGGGTGSGGWLIIRNSIPAFGYNAKAIADVLAIGSDAAPDVSRTIDDSTARIKLRGNSGNPQIATGAANAADGALHGAIQITEAGAVPGLPAGSVQFLFGFKEYVIGFRNRWANGAFDIWQRGTSFSVTNGSAPYTADRVFFVNGLGVTATVTKVASPANFRTPSALNFTATGASVAGSASVGQRFESFSTRDIAGSAATLSFDLNATTSAGALTGSIAISANSAPDNGTYSSSIFSATFAVPVGTGKLVVPIPSGNTAGFANGIGVLITLAQLTSVGNINASIGSIQLEKGVVANDFEYRPMSLELVLCQRFFQTGSTQWFGYTQSGSFYTAQQSFKTTMRASPTVAQTNTAAVGFSVTPGQTTLNVNGFTSYRGATATGATQEFDETWTASAEL